MSLEKSQGHVVTTVDKEQWHAPAFTKKYLEGRAHTEQRIGYGMEATLLQ